MKRNVRKAYYQPVSIVVSVDRKRRGSGFGLVWHPRQKSPVNVSQSIAGPFKCCSRRFVISTGPSRFSVKTRSETDVQLFYMRKDGIQIWVSHTRYPLSDLAHASSPPDICLFSQRGGPPLPPTKRNESRGVQ